MTEEDLNPQLGHLAVGDLDFVIDTATISESTGAKGERRWDIRIGTTERKLDFPPHGSFWWAPNIRGDSVRVDAPPLASIVGQTIHVPNAYDAQNEEYLFTMYVFSHEDVFDSRIRFLARHEDALRIEWRGKCNIGFDKNYGDAVPFALLADVQIGNATSQR